MSDAPINTPPTTPPTGEEIALSAQQWKVLFLGQNLSVMSMLMPDLPVLRAALELAGLPLDGDFSMDLMHGTDEAGPNRERYSFSAREVATKASMLRGTILQDLISMPMLTAALRVHDMVKLSGLNDPNEPLLEFARHYRNACAHGDRWYFRGEEPRRPAQCRDVALTADLHDARATWNVVSPRLHVEFLDDIANFFVPGLVPEPWR